MGSIFHILHVNRHERSFSEVCRLGMQPGKTQLQVGKTLRGDMVKENQSYQDIKIPRAYIASALPYSKDENSILFNVEFLPEPIITDRLHIRATVPDLAPLSVTWDNWESIKNNLGPLDVSIERSSRSKRKDIRRLCLNAIIRPTAHGKNALRAMRSHAALLRRANPVGSYLGYEAFNSGGSAYYYILKDDKDETSIIQCWDPPEKASKSKYCTHIFQMNQ